MKNLFIWILVWMFSCAAAFPPKAVYIYGMYDDTLYMQIKHQLKLYQNGDNLYFIFNSPGGYVSSGYKINALISRFTKSHKYGKIQHECASMCMTTVEQMDYLTATPKSRVLIHVSRVMNENGEITKLCNQAHLQDPVCKPDKALFYQEYNLLLKLYGKDVASRYAAGEDMWLAGVDFAKRFNHMKGY